MHEKVQSMAPSSCFSLFRISSPHLPPASRLIYSLAPLLLHQRQRTLRHSASPSMTSIPVHGRKLWVPFPLSSSLTLHSEPPAGILASLVTAHHSNQGHVGERLHFAGAPEHNYRFISGLFDVHARSTVRRLPVCYLEAHTATTKLLKHSIP